MSDIKPDIVIDSRESACPGPLMDLVGRLKKADSGTVLELQTGDSGSKQDVPEWLEDTDHQLLGIEERDGYWSIYVRKA